MIRKAELKDISAICALAQKLWPDEDYEELQDDFTDAVAGENEELFVYIDIEIEALCSVSLRTDYVEGCTSSPTGYLEGIYVNEKYRGKGIGRNLVDIAVEWSKEKGCAEFGSDVELHNVKSQKFHEAIGMTEANRIVAYIKKI